MAGVKDRTTIVSEYVLKHVKMKKDINECWSAHFVCGDNYAISVSYPGAARTAKARAKQMLVDSVVEYDRLGIHPAFVSKD